MQFFLTMECDNAAMRHGDDDDSPVDGFAVAEILNGVAARCEDGMTDAGVLKDGNGHVIGHYRMDQPTFLAEMSQAVSQLNRHLEFALAAEDMRTEVERVIVAFGKLEQWMTGRS